MMWQLAKRTKRHPLTKVQIEVLRKLIGRGACSTARSTWGVYVCGTAIAALERRGLVKMKTVKWNGTETSDYEYEITDAGRKVFAHLNANGKA